MLPSGPRGFWTPSTFEDCLIPDPKKEVSLLADAAWRAQASRALVRASAPDHTARRMKLDSKYFDMIRIHRPRPPEPREAMEKPPCCEWKGCRSAGCCRAPKGRTRDGEFYWFCVDHVRQYNASYNYFEGMSDAE